MQISPTERMKELGVKPFNQQQPVYKYRKLQSAIDVIVKNEVYFATAKELEPWDRLELHPSILDLTFTKEEKQKHLKNLGFPDCTDEVYRDTILPLSIEFFKTQIGIFSTGKSPLINPLWEKYGDVHKGVCLGFVIPANTFGTHLSFSVNYTNTPQKVKLIDAEEGDVSNDVFYWMCTKQQSYVNEEEVRLIDNNGFGVRNFLKEMLFEVIMGIETSDDDLNLISKLLDDNGYSHTSISKIKVDSQNFCLQKEYLKKPATR